MSELDDLIMDAIVDMSEGNPGAATVLSMLVSEAPAKAMGAMDTMERMNITGSRIWLGYKDHCGQDLDAFVECVLRQDDEMVDLINEMSYDEKPPATTDIDKPPATNGE